MEITKQNSLTFLGVDIISIEFKFEQTFYTKESIEIDTNFDPKCIVNNDRPNSFIIEIDSQVYSQDGFHLHFIALGKFQINSENLNTMQIKNYINANSTAIMFPYIRSFVTTFTASVGVFPSPLVLPVQFFGGEMPIQDVSAESLQLPKKNAKQKTTKKAPK